MSSPRSGCDLLSLVPFCGVFAAAQIGSGDLVGNVTDPAGATVIGAKVTALSPSAESVNFATETTSSGDFVITRLRPGVYTIRIEASGLATLERSGVAIKTGERQPVKLFSGQVQSIA